MAKQGRKLSYGSAGPGTTMNIAGELLGAQAGIAVAHVPYRGAGPAINDLLGGHVDIVIADFPVLLPLISSKSVRALALFGAERSSLLPDVPTTAELGFPQMVMENWYGVFAPIGLAPDEHATLERAILAALRSPAVVERLEAGGLHGMLGSAAFKTRLTSDIAYWGPAIKPNGHQGRVADFPVVVGGTHEAALHRPRAGGRLRLARGRCGGGRALSRQAHPPDRDLPARRQHRHHGARSAAASRKTSRPADRDRQPAGRGWRDRSRCGRQGGARRLCDRAWAPPARSRSM